MAIETLFPAVAGVSVDAEKAPGLDGKRLIWGDAKTPP
jgi:hypothetical protein